MRSVKSLVAAGAATLLSSAAFAADMAIAPPPQMYAPPPVVEDFGGWYLRGDIGFSNQRVERLTTLSMSPPLRSVQTSASTPPASSASASVTSSTTGSARTSPVNTAAIRQFSGTDCITFSGRRRYRHLYATKSEWVVLVNAYVDLGTWWCVTPFIGAGVGGARVGISELHRRGHCRSWWRRAARLAFGDNVSKWNMAWALHAGLAYKVTPNFTVELGYRYLDMGDGLTGDLRTFDGTNNLVNPTTFKNITSHDLKLGVRWNLESPQVYAPPLIRKG